MQAKKCLVWLPFSYAGRGPAESCVRIIEHFSPCGIDATVFTIRNRTSLPAGVNSTQAVGSIGRHLPFRFVAKSGLRALEQKFAKAIGSSQPGDLAYFWPGVPAALVKKAKARGLICIREMINNPLAAAKPILDDAYLTAGFAPGHGITERDVEAETSELKLHDFVFSSNAEVDASLNAIGIPDERLLKSTFGWVGSRFANDAKERAPKTDNSFRAVFVGLMNVRKGIPTLLEAWDRARINGELWLAGAPEDALKPMVESYSELASVRNLGHVSDVASLYRACDAFVFPTFEEGGPQVTYEAAACDIPIITTSMGAARLVEHDVSGVIVTAGDIDGIAAAMADLANDQRKRSRLAGRARELVGKFEYGNVGKHRASLLKQTSQ